MEIKLKKNCKEKDILTLNLEDINYAIEWRLSSIKTVISEYKAVDQGSFEELEFVEEKLYEICNFLNIDEITKVLKKKRK